jgi:hypothetical protein
MKESITNKGKIETELVGDGEMESEVEMEVETKHSVKKPRLVSKKATYAKHRMVLRRKRICYIDVSTDRFSAYLSTKFSDLNHIMQDWDMAKIRRDYTQWRVACRWLNLVVFANDQITHTHIGCVEDIRVSLDKLNGVISGGPPTTRREDGHWKALICARIPPYSNYSSKSLKEDCRVNKRGWSSRCTGLMEHARTRGLDIMISREVMDKNSPYYVDDIAEGIMNHCKRNNVEVESIFLDDSINEPRNIKPKRKNKKKDESEGDRNVDKTKRGTKKKESNSAHKVANDKSKGRGTRKENHV